MSAMTTRRMRRLARQSEPGLVTWQPIEELTKARRRALWATAALSAIALMWVPAFFQGFHSKAFEGAAILETFTVIPLFAVAVRTSRLSRLIRRARRLPVADQAEDADELRSIDTAIGHIARLVDPMRPGPARDTATSSFQAARRATSAWRVLLQRQAELDDLVAFTQDQEARRSLERSLRDCQEQVARIRGEVEDLAASMARLVAASDADTFHIELERVEEAGQRIDSVADALDQLNGLAPPH